MSLLWCTLTGVEEEDDDSETEGNPGYERDAEERRSDCDCIRTLLRDCVISPDVRDKRGASLLYHALVYDHRHAHEMVAVVVEAGADVNAPTHAAGEERPLDCELWLERDGPFASVNQRKYDYLVRHGARHSVGAASRMASEAAEAAESAADKEAARVAADAALDQRLLDLRREGEAEEERRVPAWD